MFSLPSFTAPDTEVLQSFSGLDPRLKECLEISDLNEYVERLRVTCKGTMREVSGYMFLMRHSASESKSLPSQTEPTPLSVYLPLNNGLLHWIFLMQIEEVQCVTHKSS